MRAQARRSRARNCEQENCEQVHWCRCRDLPLLGTLWQPTHAHSSAGTIKLCFSRTPKCKMVLFLTTCDSVEFHHALISSAYHAASGLALIEHPIFKLHGDMLPGERTGVIPTAALLSSAHRQPCKVPVFRALWGRGADAVSATRDCGLVLYIVCVSEAPSSSVRLPHHGDSASAMPHVQATCHSSTRESVVCS
jgi:hypothetical protein